MQNCQHCENLVAEIAATRTVVERLEKDAAWVTVSQADARNMLIGSRALNDGGPGWPALLAVIGILWVAAVTIVTAAVVERMKR